MKKDSLKAKSGPRGVRHSHEAAAAEIASRYRVVLSSHGKAGFLGCGVEMPLVFGRGMTAAQCYDDTWRAMKDTVIFMLEAGETPPTPVSEGKREQQMNIRLTAAERLRIEEHARQEGFRSVSDYMRRAALRKAS